MLKLLLKTRFRYYHNFFLYHFDRRLRIELGIIGLIFLFLLLRSPADIGYSLKFLSAPDFPEKWRQVWAAALPVIYLIFEILAFLTLRTSGEWAMLGSLPFSRPVILRYQLFRFAWKVAPVFFIGTLPFLIGWTTHFSNLFHFFIAIGTWACLFLLAFWQAFTLRQQKAGKSMKLLIWFTTESTLLTLLYFIGRAFPKWFADRIAGLGLIFAIEIFLIIALVVLLRQFYEPAYLAADSTKFTIQLNFSKFWQNRGWSRNQLTSFIFNDIIYLIRQKRAVIFMLIFESVFLSFLSLAHEEEKAAFVSLLFLEVFFSWLFLLNMLMILFERDANSAGIIRALPIGAGRYWLARWILTFFLLMLPAIIPTIILAVRFSISPGLVLFGLTALVGIPGIWALIYCNTGFALFPQVKLASYLLNLSVLMVLLFWFYMPFGSLIILGVMVFWIFKSQRHFQNMEIYEARI